MKRSLRLTRENLTELSTDELYGIVGGTHGGCVATDECTHETIDYCNPVPTLPVRDCLTLRTSCIQTCAGA